MALGNTTSPGHHLGREKGGARRGKGEEREREGGRGERNRVKEGVGLM